MYFTGSAGLTRLTLQGGETAHHTVRTEESSIVQLRQSDDYVATGTTSGVVVLRDARDLGVVEQFQPTRSRILSLDVYDNTVLTAFSEKSGTSVVKTFDIRNLSKPVHTVGDIPCSSVVQLRRYKDPTGASAAPQLLFLGPQNYHVLHLDQERPVYSSPSVSSLDSSYTCVAVSPSNLCAVVGSDKGYFYPYSYGSKTEHYVMSTFKAPQRAMHPNYSHSWKEPRSDTGFEADADMTKLASNWPEDDYMILTVPQKLRCINIEAGIVPNQWGLHRYHSYLPDPKDKLSTVLPNPYPYNLMLGNDPSRVQEYLLELRKDMKRRYKATRGAAGDDYAPMDDALQVCYSLQHRFDWKSYNELPHKVSGVDNSFPECWVTPILQSLYLCQPPKYPIRKIILRHVCKREFCMTCEIAFIFSNMLVTTMSALGLKEAALPPVVQVSNLIRTLRQLRSFSTSGAFERPRSRDDAVAKMHLVQQLMLSTLHKDLQEQNSYQFMNYEAPSKDYGDSIATLFGTEFTSNGQIHVEPRFFWEVPASALKVDEGLQHLLKQLETYNGQVQIKCLPPIIVLLLNPEHNNLKPPPSLKISRSGNKEDFNYVLNSNIIHLADDVEDTGNFVSHQRIEGDNFCLVNDYRVTSMMKTSELERMIPATRAYAAVVTFYALDNLNAPSYAANDDTNRAPNMWTTFGPLLINDVLAKPLLRDPKNQAFQSPLKSYDQIRSGDLIAIDAEYVVLRWAAKDEESAFVYTPQRKQHMGLARVSCILSRDEDDERTIMDDYVHIPEEIEDYVTQYSGIHPGDLDPLASTKSLTSLKSTYLKLRALVDCGVVFVGHGLGQDFRVCNIAVPKKQIIDTLDIFHKPGGRYLSLRFLAYHVLGESVQEDEHDSIEDARTSLRLYRRYEQLRKEGMFERVLDHVLTKGAETSWYVPERSVFRDTPVTPPASQMGSPVFKLPSNEDSADGREEETNAGLRGDEADM
ncbi:PAB-dependent poly(A)-specific ribonuclease subunit 2 [Strigomonas culicis]|nr:PAB-dependent poly(A)-specific ribonuclease subunit 2 [Strigomonas culicis]|eukprot:EPY19197.1 PAB-dependent poly(A)-specific ribonuclease subunit 2 [Strigomonas culicis]